jgi:cytochrome c oxidase cbb3-type subunit III
MKKFVTILSVAFLTAFPKMLFAQEAKGLIATYQVEIVLGLAVVVCFVGLLVLLVCLHALRVIMRLNSPVTEPVEEVSWWTKFIAKMSDAVPIEEEDKVMTDHSYDGIHELDNSMPPWWLYGFYFTILFGIGYVVYYHVLDGSLQEREFLEEMAQAKEDVALYLATLENSIDESNVEQLSDQAEIADGQAIFTQYCVACHGANGEGGVGPNLTDKYWLHGGDVKDIFKTIKYGVPAKGMISWQNQLSPKDIQLVSSFILTLEGTNPENAKEPQGDLYERAGETESTESESAEEPAAETNSNT